MWDAVELVTLDQAKEHLRLQGTTEHDADLEVKLQDAHAIVLDYINLSRGDEEFTETMLAWTDETAPKAVRAAILRQLTALFRYRGDEEHKAAGDGTDLDPGVKQLLRMYKDPVVA